MKLLILKDPPPRLPQVAARATMSMSSPATEFVLFSELPPEMRYKVWEYHMPGPRFILFGPLNNLKEREEQDSVTFHKTLGMCIRKVGSQSS